jgi:hypothetical protein
LTELDLRRIRAALSLVQAEVIIRIRAEVGGFAFAEFAFVLIAFLINGAFAIAKELFVPERINESVDAFSSVVALVVPGTGLEDGITENTRPSVRTVAVHVIDLLVRVKVKVCTVVLLRVTGKGRGSDDAGIVSAVQSTSGLHSWKNATQDGGSSQEEEGVVIAYHR